MAIDRHGRCTILDMHSFPSRSLHYELDQNRDRPDICIGTDEFHTPTALADEIVRRISAERLLLAINRPFKGALVPMRYFRNRIAKELVYWAKAINVAQLRPQ